jgi:hypothetical protein
MSELGVRFQGVRLRVAVPLYISRWWNLHWLPISGGQKRATGAEVVKI